jgi:hypothetical protein
MTLLVMPILWDLVARRKERKDRKRAAKQGTGIPEPQADGV